MPITLVNFYMNNCLHIYKYSTLINYKSEEILKNYFWYIVKDKLTEHGLEC